MASLQEGFSVDFDTISGAIIDALISLMDKVLSPPPLRLWIRCSLTHPSLMDNALPHPPSHPAPSLNQAEILVLAGGSIPPAPAVPASTRISATLKRVGNTVHP